MSEVNDDEIQIGKSKIGLGTTIRLNVKTLMVIIGLLYGGLTSIAGYAYFNLKSEIEQRNESVKTENEELKKYIKQELKENLVIVNEDIKTIIREQGDMKGDIKVLLNKTQGINNYKPDDPTDDSRENSRNNLDMTPK